MGLLGVWNSRRKDDDSSPSAPGATAELDAGIAGPPSDTSPARGPQLGEAAQKSMLRNLLTGNVMQALGLQIFIPILPIYLASRDTPSGLIGLTMASGIAGYAATQYPSGKIADRFNRRSVLLVGMTLYALAFFIYLTPISGAWIALVRFLHAGLAGLYTVAGIALLADVTPPGRRGRMYGTWQASTRAGFLIGPLLGGAVATFDVEAAFICAGVTCLASAAVMAKLPKVASGPQTRPTHAKADGKGLWSKVWPYVLIGASADYTAGAFMAIWSLWLVSNGASTWEVGASFCLFALPSVALSTWFGSLADRYGPSRLVVGSCFGMIVVGLLCTLSTRPLLLNGIALLAGLFSSVARPIVTAGVSLVVPDHFQGRGQSLLFSGLMAFQLLAAVVSGLLLAVSPRSAFAAISVVSAMSLVAAIAIYSPRRRWPAAA